jgi:hypothetical protein
MGRLSESSRQRRAHKKLKEIFFSRPLQKGMMERGGRG